MKLPRLIYCFFVLFGCLSGCDQNREEAGQTGNSGRKKSAGSKESQTDVPVSTFEFAEWADSAGVQFTYRDGQEAEQFAILESLGGGVAVVDYDLDGREDLCFAGGGHYPEPDKLAGHPGGLFQNRTGERFRDVTNVAGIDFSEFYNHGVCRGDYDSDGFPDLLVTGYGGVQLFRNQGDGTFARLRHESQLSDPSWSSSAAWGDFNNDGHLDLYVAHYVDWSLENHPYCDGPEKGKREVCPPRAFAGLPDAIFFSNGDGTFRDVSSETGILTAQTDLEHEAKGLGVTTADLDRDGDLDIYVTNDTVPNNLYANDGTGNFKNESLMSGTGLSERGVPEGSMGVGLLDYNLDGLSDLWVVNYENESASLYQNEGKLFFRNVSQVTGVTALEGLYVGWGTCCFDVDRDGDEDLFVSNGHVIRYPKNAPLRQLPVLLSNNGKGRFDNVGAQAGDYFTSPHMGRGAASGDFDRDGKLDLAISHVNEPAAILQNQTPAAGDFLSVNLIGVKSPRDPIGATIEIETSQGKLMRPYESGGSYASSNTRHRFFGIPKGVEIKSISVLWPSGETQLIEDPPQQGFVTIVEGRKPVLDH